VALEGSLEEFDLSEIIGLVERAGHTGALEVRSPDGDGALYLAEGRFCAGEAADVTGPVERPDLLRARLLDVCFQLLRAGSGTFRFSPGVPPPWPAPQRVEVGVVLGTAQRLARHWDRIQLRVPSLDDRPALNDDLAGEPLTLDRLAFRVLRATDGVRTVRQIARDLDLAAVEAAAVVADLVEHGAARVAFAAAGPAPGAATLRPGPAEATGGRAVEAARAELAARAGLAAAGAAPVAAAPGPAAAVDLAPDTVAGVASAAAAAAASAPAPAGLAATDRPGPDPEPPAPEPPVDHPTAGAGEPGEAGEAGTYVSRDRGALLRLFSALRDGDP
jgi:hypothetical protein